MSQENVEIIAELWDSDIEMDTSEVPVVVDISGVYRGKEEVRQLWKEWLSTWDALEFENELVGAGDRVVQSSTYGCAAARRASRCPRENGVGLYVQGRVGRPPEALHEPHRAPSKPWGCRSKTFTPTPEPAGYCAGDVAGERGDDTPVHRSTRTARICDCGHRAGSIPSRNRRHGHSGVDWGGLLLRLAGQMGCRLGDLEA